MSILSDSTYSAGSSAPTGSSSLTSNTSPTSVDTTASGSGLPFTKSPPQEPAVFMHTPATPIPKWIAATPPNAPGNEQAPRRNLILCFDGTDNQFNSHNSNIVTLVSALKKDDRARQMVYYQPGIGTYNSRKFTTPIGTKLSLIVDAAIAWNLDAHVMAGYEFLMQNYTANDRICIFGFSRGAYIARSLAGMIHKVGLLPVDNHQQVPFAYKMYCRTDYTGWKESSDFKKAFANDVHIDFLGVWDTVASVGLIPRRLPFTTSNTIVRTFRHAVSLDERRAKFRANLWNFPNKNTKVFPTPPGQQTTSPTSSVLGTPEIAISRLPEANSAPLPTHNANSPPAPHIEGLPNSAPAHLSSFPHLPHIHHGITLPLPAIRTHLRTHSAPPSIHDDEERKEREEEEGDALEDLDEKQFRYETAFARHHHNTHDDCDGHEHGEKKIPETDVLEVWFAGCHGDIGGGYLKNGTRRGLCRITLRWMIRECFKSETGIIFDSARLRDLGLDPATLYPFVRPRPPAPPPRADARISSTEGPWNTKRLWKSAKALVKKSGKAVVNLAGKKKEQEGEISFSPVLDNDNADSDGKGGSPAPKFTFPPHAPGYEEEEDRLDALEPMFDQLKLTFSWWILEIAPFAFRYQTKDGLWATEFRPNLGRPRHIPHHNIEPPSAGSPTGSLLPMQSPPLTNSPASPSTPPSAISSSGSDAEPVRMKIKVHRTVQTRLAACDAKGRRYVNKARFPEGVEWVD